MWSKYQLVPVIHSEPPLKMNEPQCCPCGKKQEITPEQKLLSDSQLSPEITLALFNQFLHRNIATSSKNTETQTEIPQQQTNETQTETINDPPDNVDKDNNNNNDENKTILKGVFSTYRTRAKIILPKIRDILGNTVTTQQYASILNHLTSKSTKLPDESLRTHIETLRNKGIQKRTIIRPQKRPREPASDEWLIDFLEPPEPYE